MLWYAGLRGAIAYALAKRWGGKATSQAVEGTTIMLVLLTTFCLGGTVGTLVQKLKMEMEEGDELQLSSVASLENYWQASAFATEGNDTEATAERARSKSFQEGACWLAHCADVSSPLGRCSVPGARCSDHNLGPSCPRVCKPKPILGADRHKYGSPLSYEPISACTRN